MSGSSGGYMPVIESIDLILTVGITFGFIMWLIIMSKRKSKYGLNFKRVYCPVCGTKQPMIRVPKNQNQILYVYIPEKLTMLFRAKLTTKLGAKRMHQML
jgi:hypothetical protein